MQDNSCAEAWLSALLNSLERWGAHGFGRHGHSWARMLFPILLAQYFRREFDVHYFSGCGWSLAVLLVSWEPGKPQSPRLRRQTWRARSLRMAPAQRGEIGHWGETRVPERRARPAHAQRPGSGCAAVLPPGCPWCLDAALVRHRWPAGLPARSVPFLLISAPLPTRFRSPLPHLAPVALLSTFLSPHLASVRCPPRNVCGPGLCSLPLLSFPVTGWWCRPVRAEPSQKPPGHLWLLPNIHVFSWQVPPTQPLRCLPPQSPHPGLDSSSILESSTVFLFSKKNPQSEHATSWMIAVRFMAELSVRTLASPAWTSAPSPAAVCPSALHARHTNFLLCLEEAFLLLHIPFFFSPKCPSHFL